MNEAAGQIARTAGCGREVEVTEVTRTAPRAIRCLRYSGHQDTKLLI